MVNVICPLCNKSRIVTKKTWYRIKNGSSSGKCLPCGQIGNKKTKATRLKIGLTRKRLGLTFPYLLGFKHSLVSRRKMSDAKIGKYVGKFSHSWQGGKKLEKYPFIFNEALKKHIKNKYDNKCWWCGEKKTLCVHHINTNKQDNREYNLLPLCFKCHSLMHQAELSIFRGDIDRLKNHPLIDFKVERLKNVA